MQPRQYGGVVGPDLKVHGTANVRVVDVSVVPIHVSSHLQTVACASRAHFLVRHPWRELEALTDDASVHAHRRDRGEGRGAHPGRPVSPVRTLRSLFSPLSRFGVPLHACDDPPLTHTLHLLAFALDAP